MEIKELFKKTDFSLLIITVTLIILGSIVMFSLVYRSDAPSIYLRHLILGIIGIGLVIIVITVPYQLIQQYSKLIYGLSILSLILVLFKGISINAAKSWFKLGTITIQPAEPAKLAFIIFLADYLSRTKKELTRFSSLAYPLLFLVIPVGLILLQPDIGSAIIFFPIFIVMMYLAGTPLRYILFFVLWISITIADSCFLTYIYYQKDLSPFVKFLYQNLTYLPFTIALLGVIVIFLRLVYSFFLTIKIRISSEGFALVNVAICGGILSCYLIQMLLKTYQRKRIIAFLSPQIDPLGTGYQVIQSQIAVGSGGLFGKGFLAATQGQLGFLPVKHTDFIFATFAEEFGFVGSFVMLFLFLFLFYRAMKIALSSRDLFSALLSSGILSYLFFQVFINIGMTVGIMPVTGVPLLFVSYGGSSLLTTMVAIALLLNIYSRRFTY